MESGGRIWRPTVQNLVPNPGNSIGEHAQQEVYTKTSLVANPNLQNLNREILSASQAYNNTPKPFRKNENEATTTSELRATYTVSPVAKSDRQQVNFIQQSPTATHANSSRKQMINVCQASQEENMAPKLIHKQYNSPIDLYSMNNIRKTIEAHTELIAPGIKGINFMKPETPINKQSEVYKLVKEEEEQRTQQRSARLSPISGQPLNHRVNVLSRSVAGRCEQQQQIPHKQENLGHPTQSNDKYYNISAAEQDDRAGRQADGQIGVPGCCECGQQIVGLFAKIQNRFVHPHCFNCTTCGSSLKNTGYFTVNEKLYCEIHAKQVAKVMRIQFDFKDKQDKQQLEQTPARQLQAQHDTRSQQPEQYSSSTTASQEPSFNNSNSVTISTMFANRANNNQASQTNRSWAHSAGNDGATTVEPCSSNRFMVASSNLQQQEKSRSPIPVAQPVQQQSMLSSGRVGRGSLMHEEHTLVGGRAPICVHCHKRIQGPYILAGKATWCKLCSQNNFKCNSCYRSLLDAGFIEDSSHKYYCELCFEAYYAPICSNCNIRIKGDCLNALNKQWHPSCFVCGHCHRPFGNSSFYLEDSVPYCERDWNVLFTTKCFSCSNPIEAGDKWIEALNRNYHSICFRCTSCQAALEGSTFYSKGGKPYCRLHIR